MEPIKLDFAKIHERFKDDDSVSVPGQLRWLQKQGFAQQHIEAAMAELYSDIERGDLPIVYERIKNNHVESVYLPKEVNPPGKEYTSRPIKTGWELDQALLDYTKRANTTEAQSIVANIERFELKLRKKWMKQVPWYKRVFGVKPKEAAE